MQTSDHILLVRSFAILSNELSIIYAILSNCKVSGTEKFFSGFPLKNQQLLFHKREWGNDNTSAAGIVKFSVYLYETRLEKYLSLLTEYK